VIETAVGVLVASVIGSVHCAGMCGGFVCFYTGAATRPAGDAPQATDASTLHAHALSHGGRLTSYLLLGAVAGAIGTRIAHLGARAGVAQAAAIVAGVLMVGWALSTMAAQRGVAIGGHLMGVVPVPESWQRALGRVLHAVRSQPMGIRAGLTGLLTTLLPCGWLYVFVATAGGTGSVLHGMALMGIFWLGTVPALLTVGLGAQRLLAPFRRRLPAFSAVVVLIMGLWSMTGHLRESVHVH
jgi:uncharacterized protein